MTRIYFERRGLADTGRDLDALSEEIQEFLRLVADHRSAGPFAPDYRPPVDVIETEDAIEIVADLPGVSAQMVRVVFSQGAVILAGRKGTTACDHRDATFHLAERSFGRFAYVVRLGVAVDAGRARATLRAGELHVALPRVDDRRGRDIAIAIES